MGRVIDFTDGFTSASAPTTLSVSSLTISGSRASANSIVAGTGITAPSGTSQLQFVEGSGGAVDVSANPQISAGDAVGQLLILVGRSDTNTVTLEHGTGLVLNGTCVLSADSVLTLVWDSTNWVEVNRNDV